MKLGIGLLVAILPSVAMAGGLGRPNQIGARAVGMGGGFAAIADDPSAVYHNPSGMAFPDETQVMIDLALLKLDRVWEPPDRPAVIETTGIQPVPSLGVTTRFRFRKQPAARLALGLAAYVAYGGKIAFDPEAVKNSVAKTAAGITSTGITLFEVTPAVAYQVADVLALGFALRVGIGTFEVNDVEPAFRADGLSATGAGIGGAFSATVRPHPRVQVGAIYRTVLSTSLTGGGQVAIGGGTPMRRDMTLQVTWPQSAALGVAVRVAEFLRLVAQGDWTGWSSLQRFEVAFSGGLAQTRQMKFQDSFTLHGGAEVVVSRFAGRVGFSVDTNAIPDATSRRENRDGLKGDVTAGLGVRVGPARIDAAVDYLFGLTPARMIAAGPDAEAGAYHATVLTVALSGTVAF